MLNTTFSPSKQPIGLGVGSEVLSCDGFKISCFLPLDSSAFRGCPAEGSILSVELKLYYFHSFFVEQPFLVSKGLHELFHL
jgi:hypothetical protein